MVYDTVTYPNNPVSGQADPYSGLVGDPVGPVALDYLALGMCVDPGLYHALSEYFRRGCYVCGRLEVSAGKIFFDGRAVGQVKGSVGAPSAFGRKIVWNFTGEWFRAGLTEKDAICLMHEFEVYLAELPQLDVHFQVLEALRGKPWINFVSIDRVDYAVNVRVAKALIPDDLMLIDDLPYGADWCQGAWNKKGGRTIYASRTDEPLKNRGTFDHLCVYQTKEHIAEGVIRLEYRCPRVRATDGSGSIDGAALLAAHYFEAILRREVRVLGADPERDSWEPPREGDLVVRPLNFEGKWAPEHYFRQVYSGHPTHTMMRLLKQGVSLIHRVGGAAITSRLLELTRGVEHLKVDAETMEQYNALMAEYEPLISPWSFVPSDEPVFPYLPFVSPDPSSLVKVCKIKKQADYLMALMRPPELNMAVQAPIDEEQLDRAEEMLLSLRRHFYKDSRPVALRLGMAERLEDKNVTLDEFSSWAGRFRVPKVIRVWSVLDERAPVSPSAANDFYRHDHWLSAYRSWEAGERSHFPRWGLMG